MGDEVRIARNGEMLISGVPKRELLTVASPMPGEVVTITGVTQVVVVAEWKMALCSRRHSVDCCLVLGKLGCIVLWGRDGEKRGY